LCPLEHTTFTCLLPANTTDLLQTVDIAVNNQQKIFFYTLYVREHWHAEEVSKQDALSVKLQPID